MGYVCKCFRSLYAYKHASSFYCRRGIAFSFFRPLMIISLLLSVVMVTLVVELVFGLAYHFMLSLSVIFSFLSVIFLGTSSEVWPIPLAFVAYQSWPLGNLGLTGFRIGQIGVRKMQIKIECQGAGSDLSALAFLHWDFCFWVHMGFSVR